MYMGTIMGKRGRSALLLWLLASCGEQPAAGTGTFPVPVDVGGRGGVKAELRADHRGGATFEQVAREHGEKDFAGASVEGKSFTGPSDVYLLTLELENGTGGELRAPDLTLVLPDEAGVTLRTRRQSIAPGAKARFLYYWDPGRVVPRVSARLSWAP